LKSKEHEERQEDRRERQSVRIKLGVTDYLALFVALLETAAIPLLVLISVLVIIVLLVFK